MKSIYILQQLFKTQTSKTNTWEKKKSQQINCASLFRSYLLAPDRFET